MTATSKPPVPCGVATKGRTRSSSRLVIDLVADAGLLAIGAAALVAHYVPVLSEAATTDGRRDR